MVTRSQPLLRVPIERTPAVVAFRTGEQASVQLYLPPGRHPGEILANSDRFVPIAFSTGTRLVARAAISWISVRGPFSTGSEELPMEQQKVIVHLLDGTKLIGVLCWLGRYRTLDHLNDEPGYVELHEGEHVKFVPKDHILAVEET